MESRKKNLNIREMGRFQPNSETKIYSENKRVESSLVACLDLGSIPGNSTKGDVLNTSSFFIQNN
jgi:hypothetical protein